MGRSGNPKGRTSVTYSHKVNEVKKWYTDREKWQKIRLDKAQKEGKIIKLTELKPLQFYIEKIKQPNQK